ncbi:MAG: primosomal protein N' [Micrococcales bacterium]|nr:primosomal protein N' [Micrococcales bacterium]
MSTPSASTSASDSAGVVAGRHPGGEPSRGPVARVVLDSPLPQLDRLFDYRIPPGLDAVGPGIRVRVPLRTAGRTVDAFVVETADEQQFPGPLSDIEAVVSDVPVLRPEVWALARAVATRAAGSANDVLRLAIPKRQVRVEREWLARRSAGERAESTPLVPAPIEGYPAGALESVIRDRRRVALAAIPGVLRSAGGEWVGRWARTLAEASALAYHAGRSALVAVPDYRDVEQLAAALRGIVPEGSVVRWDAHQPNPERYRGLLRAAEGPAVVIGTRSVVYAPAEHLGLIAVWNDGDPLHREPLAPYVHARDAALIRHEQQGGALILAGHARTAEVQRLVELRWLEAMAPARRPRPNLVPTASLVSADRPAEQARIPSSAWRAARDALREGPVLVQVARPGFAPGLACAECAAPARCRVCGGPLGQDRAGAIPACRWCGTPAPGWSCPNCRGTRLRTRGRGSVRTAEELGRAFPGVRVRLADGEHPLQHVGEEPALVVATRGAEPIAAGGYRAVLLLDGERMIARESLRIAEDCLRWWTDAAALAADGAPTVLVGVGGGIASALATWRLDDWVRAELADRRALRFPPTVRAGTVVGQPDAVAEAVRRLARPGLEVRGPTPVPEGARAILVFEYSVGAELAVDLRAEVIRQSSTRRAAPTPGKRGRRPVPLRVHLDDPSPFEE